MTKEKPKINITTIARAAGVSTSSVSLALNGKPGVSEETRQNILRIARESGYRHHATSDTSGMRVLQILACAEGEIVGEDMSRSPFFMDLVRSIEREARTHGYSCIVSTVSLSEVEREVHRILAPFANSGLVLLGTNLDDSQLESLARLAEHTVVIDTLAARTPLNTVVMNNRQGAILATRHLLELGHRSFGYCHGTRRISNFRERERGFLETLGEAGLSVPATSRFALTSDIQVATAEMSRMLSDRETPMPTALVCENDYLAIGAIRALTAADYRVPDDISVVGFDDIAESRVTSPELTTVHVSTDVIARNAVSRLVELQKDPLSLPVKQIVDTHLVIRQSTAAAPSS
ncbi:LacI family DNA-binding transcriptional regulator [Tropicimonas sp. IMCC6043]|uniref:LacI family DNA-binding transcriptional regulator n=1 Tax=Tropicimonas sp. IMCC6043 TaxID=2510645 RepID=UPI0013ECDA75|nr:LacI family DNA-binding transcriptional regulator [Tropicimonas sp. IMCC6043]